MKNGPIFERNPGNIILDEKEGEEYFDNLIHDRQHHHNDDEDRYYEPDYYDEDEENLGSREAEYFAMEEEEGMIVMDNDIYEGGGIRDHEYISNESEERKIGRNSEVDEGYYDCDD